jgi:hypothetical protein
MCGFLVAKMDLDIGISYKPLARAMILRSVLLLRWLKHDGSIARNRRHGFNAIY